MLLDVIHDLCLLIADIEGSGGPVPRGGEVGIDGLFIRRMDVADPLIEDNLPLSAHQLQHQNQQQHLSIHLAVFPLHHPPQFLIIIVKQLLHEIFMLGEAQLRPAIEVRREVE